MRTTLTQTICRLATPLLVMPLLAVAATATAHATVLGTVTAGGYVFTNFDPALAPGAAGSNANGISNTGQLVGTEVDANNNPVFVSYAGTPQSNAVVNAGAGQVAFGINAAGTIVGGNGTTAFTLPANGSPTPITTPPGAINAFGINDHGAIVGNQTVDAATPGFYLAPGGAVATINAPVGGNVVNAQGINNNGRIIGFYLGNDGQVHGFSSSAAGATNGGTLPFSAITDPVIPSVPGEPGATFVFSQLLGINDANLVAGYYGDSTTSQHGFLYNLATGTYTFLDDPAEGFHNGVEVTQITGINDSGELSGFYTDANGIAHSFAACPTGTVCPPATAVPEPGTLPVMATALALLTAWLHRRRRA